MLKLADLFTADLIRESSFLKPMIEVWEKEWEEKRIAIGFARGRLIGVSPPPNSRESRSHLHSNRLTVSTDSTISPTRRSRP